MTKLKILTIPNPRLKHKSLEVKSFDKNLSIKIQNMFETLKASGNGIGLAAPQVGILQRIVVVDLKENEISVPITLINPKILYKSEETFINEEGCLSVPEYFAEVTRSKEIEYEWFDEFGRKSIAKANGLLAICIQHEIDHLNGILFIDHLSALKRKLALEKLRKLRNKNIKEKNIDQNE